MLRRMFGARRQPWYSWRDKPACTASIDARDVHAAGQHRGHRTRFCVAHEGADGRHCAVHGL